MRLADFDARAVWDTSAALKGHRVRLTGFATAKKDGGWYLARLTISCCAADARTSKVEIRGSAAPAEGTWAQVTGVWQQPGDASGQDTAVPVLTVQQVKGTSEPSDPYE